MFIYVNDDTEPGIGRYYYFNISSHNYLKSGDLYPKARVERRVVCLILANQVRGMTHILVPPCHLFFFSVFLLIKSFYSA